MKHSFYNLTLFNLIVCLNLPFALFLDKYTCAICLICSKNSQIFLLKALSDLLVIIVIILVIISDYILTCNFGFTFNWKHLNPLKPFHHLNPPLPPHNMSYYCSWKRRKGCICWFKLLNSGFLLINLQCIFFNIQWSSADQLCELL